MATVKYGFWDRTTSERPSGNVSFNLEEPNNDRISVFITVPEDSGLDYYRNILGSLNTDNLQSPPFTSDQHASLRAYWKTVPTNPSGAEAERVLKDMVTYGVTIGEFSTALGISTSAIRQRLKLESTEKVWKVTRTTGNPLIFIGDLTYTPPITRQTTNILNTILFVFGNNNPPVKTRDYTIDISINDKETDEVIETFTISVTKTFDISVFEPSVERLNTRVTYTLSPSGKTGTFTPGSAFKIAPPDTGATLGLSFTTPAVAGPSTSPIKWRITSPTVSDYFEAGSQGITISNISSTETKSYGYEIYNGYTNTVSETGTFSVAKGTGDTPVQPSAPVYDNSKTYQPGDIVSFNGKYFKATRVTTGLPPTDTSAWTEVTPEVAVDSSSKILYKQLPSNDEGFIQSGGLLEIPYTESTLVLGVEVSGFVAGPSTTYGKWRQTVPSSSVWFENGQKSLTINSISTSETEYRFEAKWWDSKASFDSGQPPTISSTPSVKVKKAVAPTYTITPSVTSISNGGTVTFEIETTNVPNGSQLSWSTTGVSVTGTDFTDGLTSGIISIIENKATITRSIRSGREVENIVSFNIQLRTRTIEPTGAITEGSIVATSPTVSITVHSVTPDVLTISEGGTVTFTVTTVGVADGTVLYWTSKGTVRASDFTDGESAGQVTINSNTGSVIRSLSPDFKTEGTESFSIDLRKTSIDGQVIARSEYIKVTDSSTNPDIVLNEPEWYAEITNIPLLEAAIESSTAELSNINENFATANRFFSRMADSMEQIAEKMSDIENHQRRMRELGEGEGIHMTSPYEWFSLISLYRLFIEEGKVLDLSEKITDQELALAKASVITYINKLKELPRSF